jgi:DNA-binding CsgD family transcriptional regulator
MSLRMLQNDLHEALLFVMHEDILLGEQREHDALTQGENQSEIIPPTRTASGGQYPLTKDVCVIGRDPTCDIRVSSHRIDISRRHALIKREGTTFVLYDDSRYGTFVNGQPISGGYQLDTGDILGFANSHEMLRFVDLSADLHEPPPLTGRERDVLRLVAAGKLNKEIATELLIAPNTVNTHLKNIYEKLGAHNRTEAVNQARKLRLL